MAVLDVAEVDRDEDHRSHSQYLHSPRRDILAPLSGVFVDSDPPKWRTEARKALNLARELATKLTKRELDKGLGMTENLDQLTSPQADDLLRRLTELLHVDRKLKDSNAKCDENHN